MADFFTELRQRRVLPAVGVYAAGCWVVIEILDRLVERYLLSPYLTDLVFWGLYSLIPAVLLVAWSHGKPGKDRSTALEKVGVPLNILATAGLLFTVFGGKDLGAAANLVTVANEEGGTEEVYVPSESYRRRLAVFFFENDSGDASLDWMQYGVTELLVQDLQQNPFVLASSPWANGSNGFYQRMKRAGFDDGLGVPRSLMREIADDANRSYFVEGAVGRGGDEVVVMARVWETRSLELVQEVRETGWDFYDVVDRVSRKVRVALNVPDASAIAPDLPLAETYGESELAFRHYIAARNVRLFENDLAASNGYYDAPLEEDPNFVLAWFYKGLSLFEGGNLPAASAAFDKARELDYRLPENDRATLKQIGYRLAGENDKLIAFLRLQTRLRDDAASHANLATMLMVTGEPEDAKAAFLAALERDPMSLGAYLNLAALERATGNPQAAIEYARRYQEERPEDEEALLLVGDLMRDQGELSEATEYYEQAQLVADPPVTPLLRLANLALRNGDDGQARELVAEADAVADTALYRLSVRQAAASLEARLGRIGTALEQTRAMLAPGEESLPPLTVATGVYSQLVRYHLELRETEQARQALVEAKGMLQPPLDRFLAFAETLILVEEERLEEARTTLDAGRQILDQFRFDALRFQIDAALAAIAEAEEDPAAAAVHMASVVAQVENSLIGAAVTDELPAFYAALAHLQVESEQLGAAEASIQAGLKLDPNHPMLWLQQARLQKARGQRKLAAASVQYALAIWENADPTFRRYQSALELRDEISSAAAEAPVSS